MIKNYNDLNNAKQRKQDLIRKMQMLYSWKEYYISGIEKYDNTKEVSDFPLEQFDELILKGFTVKQVTVDDRNVIKDILLVSINVNGFEQPVSKYYNTFKTEAQIYELKQTINNLTTEIDNFKPYGQNFSRSNRSSSRAQ